MSNKSSVLLKSTEWGLRDYNIEGQLGAEPTMEKYLSNMMLWVNEVWRVLKPSGSLILNIGDCFIGGGRGGFASKTTCMGKVNESVPKPPKWNEMSGIYKTKQLLSVSSFAYCKIISETKFVCRGEHIWAKVNVPSPIRSRLKHSHEKLFWFVKDADKYYFDWEIWKKKIKAQTIKRYARAITNNSVLQQGAFSSSHRIKPNTTEKDSPHSDNIKVSKTSVYRSGHGEDYIKNNSTIEHSWRIIPVGARQSGFEQTTKQISQHIAPFPEKLIEPYIRSLCPDRVCKKCGKNVEYYDVILNPQKLGRNEIEGKNINSFGSNIRERIGDKCDDLSIRGVYEKRERVCDCGVGFERGTVLDPFLGSGTTMRLALEKNRNCIGIELNKEYIKYAKQRLNWGTGLDVEFSDKL